MLFNGIGNPKFLSLFSKLSSVILFPFSTFWLYHLYTWWSRSLYRCIFFFIFPGLLLLHPLDCLARVDYLSVHVYHWVYELDWCWSRFSTPLLSLYRVAFSVCHDHKIPFITVIFLVSFKTLHKWHQDSSGRWRQICVGRSTRSKWLSPQVTWD